MSNCVNDKHEVSTCHVCVGSGVYEDFDGVNQPCARCGGAGQLVLWIPVGCCNSCNGTGRDNGSPETRGLCWDCQGTGHTHDIN